MKKFKMINKLQFLIIIILGTIFLIACTSPHPFISLEIREFDFGDVENGKIMKKEIFVENIGEAPLIVESISTSCGCTEATLEPMTIMPGELGTLFIEFDSGAHGPELNGELKRQIFIVSNDPDNPETVIEFSSNVVSPNN